MPVVPNFRQLLTQPGYGELGQPKSTILVHDVLVFLKAIYPTNGSYFLSYDVQYGAYNGLARHFLSCTDAAIFTGQIQGISSCIRCRAPEVSPALNPKARY